MWIRPRYSISSCSIILIGHNVQLVEVYLGNVVIGSNVDALWSSEGEGHGGDETEACSSDGGNNVRQRFNGDIVNCDECRIAECGSSPGNTTSWSRREAFFENETVVIGVRGQG